MALWWDEWPYDGMNGLMKGWMALWRDELQLATWALIFAVSTFRGEVAASPSGRSRFPLNRLMVTMLKKRDFFLPQLSISKYIYIHTINMCIYIVIYLFWEFFVASPQIHAKTQVPQIFTKKIQTVFLKYHLWVSINSWPCSLCQSSKMKNVQKLSDHERIQLPVVEHLWSFFAVQGGLAPVMSRDNNPPKMALYSWVTGVMGPYEQTNRRDTL